MRRFLLVAIMFSAFSAKCQISKKLRFRHTLSQEKIDNAGFEIKQIGKTWKIAPDYKLKCNLASDGKGNINMEVWPFKIDHLMGDTTYINSATPAHQLIVTDNRESIGFEVKSLNVLYNGVTANVATVPVRYRPKSDSSGSTFSSSISISYSFGYTIGFTRFVGRSTHTYSVSFGPLFGLSTVDIKKETVKTPKEWERNKGVASTALASTVGHSITFARDGIGIVFSIGRDFAMGPDANKWSYQNQLWYGIGLTTSFAGPK